MGDSDQLPSVSPGQVLADLLQIPWFHRLAWNGFTVRAKNQLESDSTGILLSEKNYPEKADAVPTEIAGGHIPATIEKILGAALRVAFRLVRYSGASACNRTAGIDAINIMQDLLNPRGTLGNSIVTERGQVYSPSPARRWSPMSSTETSEAASELDPGKYTSPNKTRLSLVQWQWGHLPT